MIHELGISINPPKAALRRGRVLGWVWAYQLIILSLCLYLYIYIYIYMYIYICIMYICIYCIYIYIFMYARVSAHIYIYIHMEGFQWTIFYIWGMSQLTNFNYLGHLGAIPHVQAPWFPIPIWASRAWLSGRLSWKLEDFAEFTCLFLKDLSYRIEIVWQEWSFRWNIYVVHIYIYIIIYMINVFHNSIKLMWTE